MLKSKDTDELLTQYLLGNLPPEEAERLDQLSVSDDETAHRLVAVENDLVDAYVRGELAGKAREQFRTSYMASPRRREKVMVADAMRSLESRRVEPEVAATRGWMRWLVSPAVPRFAFIALLLVIAGMSAYLLRRPESNSRMIANAGQRVNVTTRPTVSTSAPTVAPPPRSDQPAAALPAVSFLLAPPTRSAGQPATLSIPADAARVTVQLQLESDDFPEYRAALRDLATDEIGWRSAALRSTVDGRRSVVAVDLPRAVLKPQTWSIELSGVARGADPELIASYTFRVRPE